MTKFNIPKPNFNETINQSSPKSQAQFNIPKLNKTLDNGFVERENKNPNPGVKFNIPKPNFINSDQDNTPPKRNLFVPKLDLGNKSSSPSVLDVNSLTDYAKTHLTCEEDVEIKPEISDVDMSNINFNDPNNFISKSLTAIGKNKRDSLNNDWHIDLSIALKQQNSMPALSNDSSPLENFDINFIDCEDAIPKVENRTMLACTMDTSRILNLKIKHRKSPSLLGKVLCKKYKQIMPLIVELDEYKSKFDFKTASPDDVILRNLFRKSNKK